MNRSTNQPLWILLAATMFLALRSMAAGDPSAAQGQSKKPVNDPVVQRYQRMITPEGLAARLYFFASDLFEGREATTRGQKLAAHYLASQYRQMGLSPRGTAKPRDALSAASYFQEFPVFRRNASHTRLSVSIDGRETVSSEFDVDSQDGLSFFALGDTVDASGGVVFAGYGIADPKLGYNDYAALAQKGINVEGKWVMMLDDEPLEDGKTSLLPTQDHKPSTWSTQFLYKKSALWKAGKPKGVLVVADVSPRVASSFSDRAAQAAINLRRVGNLTLAKSSGFPPTFDISSKLADQILAPTARNIQQLRNQINSNLKPEVFAVPENVKVTAQVKPFPELNTENVLALIEGSDPRLKDEVIVISAHYDHLGINPALSGDQIFNGAADDGSGVVAVLELAQQFMRAKRDGFGPKRSILFINFSGEEKGLLGSTYYTQHQPVIPLARTIANINLDGVGGFDPKHPNKSTNYIYLIGNEKLSGDLLDVSRRVNDRLRERKLELTPGPRFNSDQLSFESQLVPYVYFSSGLTEHYHQTSDEPNTIDYDHLARVTRLIFGTAWEIANRDAKAQLADRERLALAGYVCPPCPFECDEPVYAHPGECPVCGMALAPKYELKGSPVKSSPR